MKDYLFTYLLICLFIGCKNSAQTGTINELRLKNKINPLEGKIFYRITQTDSIDVLYEYCDADIRTIKIYKDSIYVNFGQESEYYIITELNRQGDSIVFKGLHSFNILTSSSKKFNEHDISNIEIKNINVKDHTIKYLEDIYIDSTFANRLPYIKQPCIECHEKEMCDEWAREEKEKQERPKYITEWQGTYSFDFGGVQMGEEFEGSVTFKIENESSKVNFNTNEKILEIINATKDTIQLQDLDGDIYKIYKDEQGSFNVSGHAIYMLNPPNERYLLTKED